MARPLLLSTEIPSLACGARRRAHRTGLLRSGLLLRSGEARGSASDDSSRTRHGTRGGATAAAVAAAAARGSEPAAAARGSERGCKAGARPVAALRDLKAVIAGSWRTVTLSVRLQHHSELDSSRRYHRDQIKRVLILLLLLTLSLPRSLLRVRQAAAAAAPRLGGSDSEGGRRQALPHSYPSAPSGGAPSGGSSESPRRQVLAILPQLEWPTLHPIHFLPAIRSGLEGWYAEGPNLKSR